MFKRMLGALGVGGPSVDTVLTDPRTYPGGPVTGRVDLVGGSHDASINDVTLSLIARVETSEEDVTGEFHRVTVSGPLHLAAGQEISIPFHFEVPWETPITAVYGQPLHGMALGLRTDVSIDQAVDKGDLDPLQVEPLPVQHRILDALQHLGFAFQTADLECGHIAGSPQTLPFYQEIEYRSAPQYAHSFGSIELTFVTTPYAAEVVLEFDGSHDSVNRYTVQHNAADTTDWAAQVDAWLQQAAYQRQHAGYGAHEHSHGSHGDEGGGMGGVLLGAAGGFAAGYLAEEAVEEFFEDDEEEEEEED
ncbi:hypothetical protein GCM10009828_003180 [Actinoplanes couchii]|uniref:SpoOM family protein n=1 Tax=Actinoplanes couchii TaxID=403638 RepID=A0ABQ3XMW4_9ACTN|nr:hypothetical protein Aco03nite_082500 [Actinoplanes couchii]